MADSEEEDKEREAFRKHCSRLIGEFRPMLFLNEWFMVAKYEKLEEHLSAHCVPLPNYMEATITIGDYCFGLFKEKKSYELASTLCHELVHCITHELFEHASDSSAPAVKPFVTAMNEKLTQRISNILLKQLDPVIYEIAPETPGDFE